MKLTSICRATLFSVACSASRASSQDEQAVFITEQESVVRPKNVAIIGAGAAGSSAAYHLQKFASNASIPLNLTVFERNPYIGGRSTTVNVYDDPSQPVELGASIFVEVNQILVDAVKEFGLSTSEFVESQQDIPGAALGVWNGKEFVVEMASETGWWDYAKLFWRYGLAPVRTKSLMKKTVGKFLRLYDDFFPFESLTQAAQDAGLLAVTAATGEQYLRENNIGFQFAREIIQASTRVNYAQNLAYIHGLEAMVCMATEGAMAVQGGNWQIFHNMVASTNSHVLPEVQVSKVEAHKDGKYSITAHSISSEEAADVDTASFDEVILAAPFQHANISIAGIKDFEAPDRIPYVRLYVTLFTSPHLPDPRKFGLSKDKAVPHVILTTLAEDEGSKSGAEGVGNAGFFSASLLRAVTNPKTRKQEYLYKVFSAKEIGPRFFTELLDLQRADAINDDDESVEHSEKVISWVYRKMWHSYPYEYPRVTFEEIKLFDHLWYTSGIESFISTMETSALMGKNVARLVVDGWEEERQEAISAQLDHKSAM